MLRKICTLLVMLTAISLLLSGCMVKKIKLDFIKQPDGISLKGNRHREEIEKLGAELKKLRDKGEPREAQDRLLDRIAAYGNDATVDISSPELIEKIISGIKHSEGIVDNNAVKASDGKDAFYLQLTYTAIQNHTLEDVKQGYISSIIVLQDGTALVPIYSKSSPSNVTFARTMMKKETMDEIKDYYDRNTGFVEEINEVEGPKIYNAFLSSADRVKSGISFIKESLKLGMGQSEVMQLLGSSYKMVQAAESSEYNRSMWRYDFMCQEGYYYNDLQLDGLDIDGLSNGKVKIVLFISFTEDNKVMGYSIYYFNPDDSGVYGYSVSKEGTAEDIKSIDDEV